MNTITRKKHFAGWTAVSEKELKKLDDKNTLVMRVSTNKNRTNISVNTHENSNGFHIEKHAVFEDYCKEVARSNIKRATEKAVITAHEKALLLIEPHIEAIKAQYNL